MWPGGRPSPNWSPRSSQTSAAWGPAAGCCRKSTSRWATERGRMNRILITGAAGKIGSTLREGLRGRYPVVRLSDIGQLGPARDGAEIAPADLTDLGSV